jgi:hypothetical protein
MLKETDKKLENETARKPMGFWVEYVQQFADSDKQQVAYEFDDSAEANKANVAFRNAIDRMGLAEKMTVKRRRLNLYLIKFKEEAEENG